MGSQQYRPGMPASNGPQQTPGGPANFRPQPPSYPGGPTDPLSQQRMGYPGAGPQ